ncbi:MAG TPA: NUDIX hydrolase [Alphaproteobacteria bacterium]|nr:NUDIX hydrolase [Alphaproteobacteria bacterium]HAJ46375.1 NUDIX hydrolase [Alphaproteobacteria bacterium]
MSADLAKTPIPSATLMLLRDSARGLEVFMVKRHHQIDFASGALVFPGGKLAKGDSDPAVRGHCDGADGLDEEALALRVCAVREGFEESGILLARPAGCPVLAGGETASAAAPWRSKLDKGECGIAEFAATLNVRPALDQLVPFARWITPTFMPKRFDTHFFLALAPYGQLGRHDGSETVDSIWVTVEEALSATDRWTIIFPTKMNLLKLGRAKTVEAAFAMAQAQPVVLVEPVVIEKDGKSYLRLPPEAGYDVVEEPLESVRG